MASAETGARRPWLPRLQRVSRRLAQRILGKRLFCLLRYGRANPNSIAYWNRVYAREGRSVARLYPNKHRAIVQALPSGGWVLDAGCGPGYLLEACRQAGCQVVGLDFSREAVRLCRERALAVCVAALPQTPFRAGAFHVVILSEVIEHLSEPGPALREAVRLLRPGGLLVVTVPDRPAGVPDWCPEHVHAFDAGALRRLLESVPGVGEVRVEAVRDEVPQPTGEAFLLDHLVAVATVG